MEIEYRSSRVEIDETAFNRRGDLADVMRARRPGRVVSLHPDATLLINGRRRRLPADFEAGDELVVRWSPRQAAARRARG